MRDTLLSPAISPADARRIDDACDAFEAAWKAGRRPRIEEHLGAAAGTARPALLRQLLLLDWEYRRRAGDRPAAGDYLYRFTGDADQVESVCRELAATPDPTWLAPAGPAARGAEASDTGDAERYQLLNELGRGGIGVVLRGRDRHLGRELAVKVLRESHRDGQDARDRFTAEARICSQLQHPAIVPVYDSGRFDDGRPFIAMKLVQGHTLAALLQRRADPADDLPRLLGVFEQVCQAVAYAHDRGVVHRDLKPANVMVGAFGEVQVMDWGFAKVLGAGGGASAADTRPLGGVSDVTQTGTLMGTPSYMPPEQARGDAANAGPPADVFALGAILCEILTGHPPYPPGTADEVCYQASIGNLDAARARLDACGADQALRQLAGQCLAAEPAARPPHAGVVAEALTRHLASVQECVRQSLMERVAAEARADEAAAKVQVERRARRSILALAAALLLGVAVASWQAVAATRAEREAVAAAKARQEAKETAVAKEAEARAILDFVQNRVFAAARPEGQDGGLGRDVPLRKALEAALPTVATQFAGQPLTEARLRVTLGDSFYYLNDAQLAADQFERARTLYAQHVGPDHIDTTETLEKLAASFAALGRHPDALRLREEALARNKATFGPDHPATLSATNNLALSYQAQGRDAEALALREDLMPRFRATFGPDHVRTLGLMNNLALSYQAQGRHADALKLREAALPLWQAKLGPDHPDALRTMNAVAGSYYTLGRYADAFALAAQALPLQKAKLGPNHTHTLQTMNTLAGCHEALGRHADALPLFEEILAVRKSRLGVDHPGTFVAMNNLANSYAALGRHADALKLRGETLSLRKAKLPADHPDITWSISNLASSYADLGRHADALKLREEALARWKAQHGPDHPDTLWGMGDVAASLIKLDRGEEAVPLIDECVRRSAGRAVHPDLVPSAMNNRMRHFEKVKDVAGCRATAELWEALGRSDAESLYDAACFRAVVAAVVRAADSLPATREQSDAEAARAVAWLKRAIAAGYKDIDHIASDADLAVLRDREDFRSLTAERKPDR